MNNEEIKKALLENFGPVGAMISGSKSGYRMSYPDNLAVFNSNLIMRIGETYTKVWFGDIDITKSQEKLKDLSKRTGCHVFVLREMDGRFENEEFPKIDRYVYRCYPDGSFELGETESLYYDEKIVKKS